MKHLVIVGLAMFAVHSASAGTGDSGSAEVIKGYKIVQELKCPADYAETFSCRGAKASVPRARGNAGKHKADLIICQKTPNDGLVISYYGQMINDGYLAQQMTVESRNQVSGEVLMSLAESQSEPGNTTMATLLAGNRIQIGNTLIECQ
jgi:hypothetical protein